jgi:hypothetical protein
LGKIVLGERSFWKKHKGRIITLIGLGILLWWAIVYVPNPLPKPEYVPTIVNGLVASMSILMAFALFHLTQHYAHIQDKGVKAKFHLRATIYILALFFIMLVGTTVGYKLVLTNDLGIAFSWFMCMFIIMYGVIMEIWDESALIS